jgi:hypothetical protein
MMKRLMLVALLSTTLFACKDKAAEKRIAELEARLNELEGKKSVPLAGTASKSITPETQPAEEKPEGPLPVMEFVDDNHDFGTIKEGDVVEYTFKFKNTGDAPLIIQNASASCGCTVPDWTKNPIEAGSTGFVKAKFDSKGKSGIQNKTITVTANTWPKQSVVKFKANITPKADGSDGPVK